MGVESSVSFFFWRSFAFSRQRNWENFGKFCFSSVNPTKFSLLKYFSKFFNIKKNEEKQW
jgi:hypothetical protein